MSAWMAMGKSVMRSPISDGNGRRFGRRLLASAALIVGLWITFFDSHSLVKRLGWHSERANLQAENDSLYAEIDRLEREVEKGLSDEVVEEIAREQYGMRRPGETVYPVETAD
jgi:cell division protein FtsB